jgi:hypothetical protein
MSLSVKRIVKPFLPEGMKNAGVRALSALFYDKMSLEKVCRESFFNLAFKALTFNGIDGDYAEFGCHGGCTFALAYQEIQRFHHGARLWAFDSFEGLPAAISAEDEHRKWIAGDMSTSLEEFRRICGRHRIPAERYTTVKGFYNDTLGAMADGDAPANLCLVYIDCYLYSSTMDVLRFLMPRLKHGMILAFDDYYCWSNEQISGERRAALEFFEGNKDWSLLPYIQYGWAGASFVVESRHVLNSVVA